MARRFVMRCAGAAILATLCGGLLPAAAYAAAPAAPKVLKGAFCVVEPGLVGVLPGSVAARAVAGIAYQELFGKWVTITDPGSATQVTQGPGTREYRAVSTKTRKVAAGPWKITMGFRNSSIVCGYPDPVALRASASRSIRKGTRSTLGATLTDTMTKAPVKSAAVTLYQRAASEAHWTRVAAVRTTSKGAVRRSVHPSSTTYYEWKYVGRSKTYKAGMSAVEKITVRR